MDRSIYATYHTGRSDGRRENGAIVGYFTIYFDDGSMEKHGIDRNEKSELRKYVLYRDGNMESIRMEEIDGILRRKCTGSYRSSRFTPLPRLIQRLIRPVGLSLIPPTSHSGAHESFQLGEELVLLGIITGISSAEDRTYPVFVGMFPSPMGIPSCWLNISSSLYPCGFHSER
jgi:hypothetical protein